MSQIVNQILDAYVSHLTNAMITTQTDTDLVADVVKKGLLQITKTTKNVQIGVTGGDHEDPNYRDAIVTVDDLPNAGFVIDPREIGGGQYWMRRFVAKLEVYWIIQRFNENVAHDKAYEILGRLMSNIENAPVNGLVDSYEERAIKPFLYANTFFQSGGPPASYIFRGKVQFQVLTERP